MDRLGYQIFIILLAGLGLAGFLVIFYIYKNKQLNAQLSQVQALRDDSTRQLEAVLKFTRNFVEAVGEKEIIEKILQFSMQITGATVASFIPLDDLGQPAGPIVKGEFPFPLPDAWIEYLASPSVRQGCADCNQLETFVKICPLLKGPFSDAMGVFCFPLRYAGKELGVLSLYMSDAGKKAFERQVLLRSLIDTTAFALESERLRRRELAVLSQMRGSRNRNDLRAVLSSMLENLHEALDVEFTLLAFNDSLDKSLGVDAERRLLLGEILPDCQVEIETHLHEFDVSNQPLTFRRNGLDGSDSLCVLAGSKIAIRGSEPMGHLIVGSRTPNSIQSRHIELLQTTAEEIWRVIHDTNQMAEVEYKTLFGERTRLAREIHDGLAQTLGFLKLQLAQMQGYLERNEVDRLRQVIRSCYEALSKAYQDTREVIDTLRIQPEGEESYRLQTWLKQLARYYEENPGDHPFEVILLGIMLQTPLPSEVHAQLIRIVQEALSNVRKHSRAKHVWISCNERSGDLILEVRDDGRGFTSDELPLPSQHGLRGMRERSELIGADFQVVSRPGDGAAIRVRLPLVEWVGLEG
jgi:two-component system nitrate/nitrite sensor histidine kinase NarX